MHENDEADYAKVPSDFPHPVALGAVPGAQPKLLVTSYQGKFYAPGCSPPELYDRWLSCEDIAQELSIKSRESKAGKRSHMSEVAILEQYLPRLIRTGWTSEAEARWVIRRVAQLLEWRVPAAAAMKA
jgi:hypothetical protein